MRALVVDLMFNALNNPNEKTVILHMLAVVMKIGVHITCEPMAEFFYCTCHLKL